MKEDFVVKDYKLTGADYLNLLLVKDLSLQGLADRQEKKATTIFNIICEYIETLDEKEQLEILDEMYFSKKFTIFFTVAKAAIIGKKIEYIKKTYGVTQYHLHHVELLKKTPLLKEEVKEYKKAWDETVVVYIGPIAQTKGNTRSVQAIRGTW